LSKKFKGVFENANEVEKLTVLLLLGLPGLDELGEALELTARHGSIASFLNQQILLEMLIKVLFEC